MNPISYDDLDDHAQRESATPEDWEISFKEYGFKGETFAQFILRSLKADLENGELK